MIWLVRLDIVKYILLSIAVFALKFAIKSCYFKKPNNGTFANEF